MKHSTKRAAPPAAQRNTSWAMMLARENSKREAMQRENDAKFFAASKPITIMLSAPDYGNLAAGAIHHGVTVEELLSELVAQHACEWFNHCFVDFLEE